MSLIFKLFGNNSVKLSTPLFTNSIKSCSNSSGAAVTAGSNYLQYDKDPAPYFFHPNTQKLLKSMTRMNLEKIYQTRTVAKSKIEYKFMTTEQIENDLKRAVKRAYRLLQMPPIVSIQEDTHQIIAEEPALSQFDTSPYIFTDITYGISDKNRTIVVRHPNGTLENASPDIRKHMNTIYFPIDGRKLRKPKMFIDANMLQQCLDSFNYEFVLNRCCVQFEPYEKEFHQISAKCFMHINEHLKFDVLRSTRHFGPMAFFYAWHRIIDDLLIDMIKRDYLKNAIELICLYYQLNGIKFDEEMLQKLKALSDSEKASLMLANKMKLLANNGSSSVEIDLHNRIGKSEKQFQADDLCLRAIDEYSKVYGIKKSKIEMSLEMYRQQMDEKRQLLDGLQKAHGIS